MSLTARAACPPIGATHAGGVRGGLAPLGSRVTWTGVDDDVTGISRVSPDPRVSVPTCIGRVSSDGHAGVLASVVLDVARAEPGRAPGEHQQGACERMEGSADHHHGAYARAHPVQQERARATTLASGPARDQNVMLT